MTPYYTEYIFLFQTPYVTQLSINHFIRLKSCPGQQNFQHVQLFLQITNWINRNIASNPEQAEAVRCIVQGSSGQLPFIIWGPPGTPYVLGCMHFLAHKPPALSISAAIALPCSGSATSRHAKDATHYTS